MFASMEADVEANLEAAPVDVCCLL